MPTLLSIARPNDTTAYAAGDLIANSTDAGEVTPFAFKSPGQRSLLRGVRLRKSGTGALKARLWILSEEPELTSGDNDTLAGDFSEAILATLTGEASRAVTDGAFVFLAPEDDVALRVEADTQLYAVLTATDTFNPTGQEAFTITPDWFAV